MRYPNPNARLKNYFNQGEKCFIFRILNLHQEMGKKYKIVNSDQQVSGERLSFE